MSEKPVVLIRVPFPKESIELLQEDFVVHYGPSAEEFEVLIKEHGPKARAVIANGTIGLTGDQIRRIPNIEFIQTVGVGFENVDMDAAREMGAKVANNSGTNAMSVAEHAFALLLAVMRDIVGAQKSLREGIWEPARYPRPLIFEKRVGILGLGEIGMGVARRAEAFEADVGYHNRNKRDVPYAYYGSTLDLARNSDILVICAPGGPETKNLVNKAVLEALGPQGVVINVGRGPIVDTDALVEALNNKTIAGAGLDVWTGEPGLPQNLLDAPNLVLSPHIAGRSPEAIVLARRQISNNLKAHFNGGAIIHRVL